MTYPPAVTTLPVCPAPRSPAAAGGMAAAVPAKEGHA